MQSEWDSIVFELNRIIGKLIKLSESTDEFDSLLASSYREEISSTRDSMVATIQWKNHDF